MDLPLTLRFQRKRAIYEAIVPLNFILISSGTKFNVQLKIELHYGQAGLDLEFSSHSSDGCNQKTKRYIAVQSQYTLFHFNQNITFLLEAYDTDMQKRFIKFHVHLSQLQF